MGLLWAKFLSTYDMNDPSWYLLVIASHHNQGVLSQTSMLSDFAGRQANMLTKGEIMEDGCNTLRL